YEYDPDGNLISITGAGGTTRFTYDDEDRLIAVATATDAWAYDYDALGNREAATHNGQRTEYLIDPIGLANLVGEYNGTGGLAPPDAQRLGLPSRVSPAGASYYDFDAIGSVAGLAGDVGGYQDRYVYAPFGEQLVAEETVANPFQFVGQFGVMHE